MELLHCFGAIQILTLYGINNFGIDAIKLEEKFITWYRHALKLLCSMPSSFTIFVLHQDFDRSNEFIFPTEVQ